MKLSSLLFAVFFSLGNSAMAAAITQEPSEQKTTGKASNSHQPSGLLRNA